jgi:hypothetical protein
MSKAMRIVSFVPFPNWTFHFGTDLEIIQNHLDAGDEVEVIVCNSTLATCDTNPSHYLQYCLSCIGKRLAGFRLLSGRFRQRAISSLGTKDKSKLETLQYDFSSLEELKNYTFYGFDIGYAALASLVSILREPKPDLQAPQTREMLRRLLATSARIFLGFGDYLDSSSPDRVYVFNARLANTRAVLRACQFRHIECVCHDRGSTIDKYEVYRNTLPHDRSQFAQALATSWGGADPEARNDMGRRFFIERREAIVQSWIAFTKDQQAGVLPHAWDSSKRNIAIFVSSEDEYVAIGKEWEGGVYESQDEGILQIAHAFADLPQFHFYVRIHPNLKHLDNSQTRMLCAMNAKNLTVISADSPVCSYTLIDQCEKVVVFDSTVGIEATYVGKPSIACRPTLYSSLEGAYQPTTHAEVVALICANLEPKSLTSALIYGYHMRTFGRRFKYFQPSYLFDGTFKRGELKPIIGMRGIIGAISWIGPVIPARIRQILPKLFGSIRAQSAPTAHGRQSAVGKRRMGA